MALTALNEESQWTHKKFRLLSSYRSGDLLQRRGTLLDPRAGTPPANLPPRSVSGTGTRSSATRTGEWDVGIAVVVLGWPDQVPASGRVRCEYLPCL